MKEFMHRKRKLNVLINNAAMMSSCRDLTPRCTADGLEITMATNHLGRFGTVFVAVELQKHFFIISLILLLV